MSLMVLFTMALDLAAASSGWDNGNAGDAYVSEFVLTARDLVQRLDLVMDGDRPVYDTSALRAAIAGVKVVSQEQVFLDGFERDAVNYPTRRLIEMSRTRWRPLRRANETRARSRVVLHEYLWVSGVDDADYSISDRLIGLLSMGNFTPNIWWNPINPVNFIAPALAFAPDGCAFRNGTLNVRQNQETLDLESAGNCGAAYRRLRVEKETGQTPVSSHVHGKFHVYHLSVFDREGAKIGEVGFEPEWGACLIPEDGPCRASGKLIVGGVEIVFWYLRD